LFEIVLYEPEIPPNTGNIIRLCANTGCRLHLIRPLGFKLDNTKLKRAGLDYKEYADILVHDSFEKFITARDISQVFAFSTRGHIVAHDASFTSESVLLFGPETRGLPRTILDKVIKHNILRLPMAAGSRSLNLSNAVAIAVYEAWRQNTFLGSKE
jgi:tRNA (cytidine/uridine-2'-O-)-methyltransferase